MPRYYFNVRHDDELIRDLEGSKLDSLERARKEATRIARDLIAESLKAGEDPNHRQIEIVDESGKTVSRVVFADILSAK